MRKSKQRYLYLFVNVTILLCILLDDPDVSWGFLTSNSLLPGRRYLQALTPPSSNYNQSHIERAVPKLHSFAPRLLVFHNNTFEVYTIKHNTTFYHDNHDFNYRSVTIIPLLVHTLRTYLPHRFAPNMPPFQLLFTDSDSLRTHCVNPQEWEACDTHNWSPILAFGSLMKDSSTTFPTVQLMPTPPFMECLYNYVILQKKTEECKRKETLSGGGGIYQPTTHVDLKDLVPTIIWRGSDYAFLYEYEKFRFWDIHKVIGDDDLKNISKYDIAIRLFQHWNDIGPRWRSIALSLQAELEHEQQQQYSNQQNHQQGDQNSNQSMILPVWLNSRLVGPIPFISSDMIQLLDTMGVNVQESEMSLHQMAMTYRYHLDLGGGGGTSWLGTISKLRMPGVLFHHETPTRDWFHGEDMIAWKHYIPIQWDLTDLRAKYDWAEATVNNHRVRQISQEATQLANYLVSPTYMQRIFDSYFVQSLPQFVHAYQSDQSTSTWDSCLHHYHQSGFQLQRMATCHEKLCTIQAEAVPTVTSMRKLRHQPLGT